MLASQSTVRHLALYNYPWYTFTVRCPEICAARSLAAKTSLLVLRDTPAQRVLRWLLLLGMLAVIGWRLYLAIAPRLAA